jgi:hypothetical protein
MYRFTVVSLVFCIFCDRLNEFRKQGVACLFAGRILENCGDEGCQEDRIGGSDDFCDRTKNGCLNHNFF